MRRSAGFIVILILVFLGGMVQAKSDFLKQFESDYSIIGKDVLKTKTEVGTVSNFVYQKDVATFTFESGTFYLLSYVNDRPTTAVFIGQGRAHIGIPSSLEQSALMAVAPDSVVDETFETCYIRIADDFDLKLREVTTFQKESLAWRAYNKMKQAQGGYYFRPLIHHHYDNYFQLLRSIYERDDDGYFWIDFNRFVFNFDPNRCEQVIVAYEYEGGDEVITEAAIFQRRENAVYDELRMSEIPYETVLLETSGQVEVGGSVGGKIENAAVTVKLRCDRDSLKFISTYLDDGLSLDSLHLDGQPVDYHRRGSFAATGIILPEYRYLGDTLNLTFFYHGNNYLEAFPYVDNPLASRVSLTFTQPKGYNYLLPGRTPVEKISGKYQFTVNPPNRYRMFNFRGYVTGLDTIPVISDIGITLSFLKSAMLNKRISDCYIPQDIYQNDILEAFNFMCGHFGPPQGVFQVFVSPHGSKTMPGLMEAPQIACVNSGMMEAYGGFKTIAGLAAAKQWFGALLQPATDREFWLAEALPQYVSLLYLEKTLGGTFYANLATRKDSVMLQGRMYKHMPLAAGLRCHPTIRSNKGLWILHMLRNMMRDLETNSDRTFLKFLRSAMAQFSAKPFTNADIIQLASKHYGEALDSFFQYWLFGGQYPEFNTRYSIKQEDDGYYADMKVAAKNVGDDFVMPVVMGIVNQNDNSTFQRQMINGTSSSFKMGPFTEEPSKVIFNEFNSILSDDSVKRD